MDIPSILGLGLTLSCGKFLLKQSLGLLGSADAAEVVSDAVADVAKDQIKDAADRHNVGRRFENLGDRVQRSVLLDLRESHPHVPAGRWEPILERLRRTLGGTITAGFVVHHRADSARLFEALKGVTVHGLPPLAADDIPLFVDALRASARYLVAVANKLPAFEVTAVGRTLDMIDALHSDLIQVMDDVRAIRQRVELTGGPTAAEYERDYRQAVSESLDWVELFGADLPAALRRVRLRDAYVTLSLEPDGDDEADTDAPRLITTEAALAELLPQTGRMLIRGAAGGGKTTLVRWTAIQAARQAPPEPVEYQHLPDGVRIRSDGERDLLAADAGRDWRRRVPFVVYLRHCDRGVLPAPRDFPTAAAKPLGSPPPHWVEQTLNAGRGLILIDGIDEVPVLERNRLRGEIAALVAAYPGCYFVLTTRPEAVDPGWLADYQFKDVTVDVMATEARDALIRRWYEAVARRPTSGDPLATTGDQLIAALSRVPALAGLANTPLLCAMTCALFEYRRGVLPADLREMCETLTHLLLHRLDQERQVRVADFGPPYGQLSYQQKKEIARRVACHMVLNEESALGQPAMLDVIGRTLDRMPDRNGGEADAVFRGLLDRGGLWREDEPADADRPARIAFQHNTFKEFLAGEVVAEEGNAGLLADRLDRSGWQRVGLFAVAAGSAAFQNDFLGRLLACIPDPLPRVTQRTQADAGVRQLAFYAYQCRAVALRCDGPVKARLNALASQLVPPRNFTDAACLAAGGDQAVPLLRYERRYANAQAACVRALKLIGTPAASETLRDYWRGEFRDNRQTVGWELMGTADPFEVFGEELIRAFEGANPYVPHWVIASLTHLRPLDGNSGVETLSLFQSQITDLSPLRGMTGLTRLRLHQVPVADLSHLSDKTKLRSVELWYSPVRDVSPLGRCVDLQDLDLSNTAVEDLGHLAALDQLRDVRLQFGRVRSLAPLALSKGLQRLRLVGVSLDDPCSLSHLTSLSVLHWQYRPIPDLTPLSTLVHLTELDLAASGVSDLTPLAGLINLRHLNLRGTHVTDLSPLAHLTELKITQ